MRTGKRHPMCVWKRLCVYVLGGKPSIYFSKIKKYFGFFGYRVKEIVIFNIGFGFPVLNSIWWHGFKNNRHFFVRNIWGDILGFSGPLRGLPCSYPCTSVPEDSVVDAVFNTASFVVPWFMFGVRRLLIDAWCLIGVICWSLLVVVCCCFLTCL